MAGQAKGKPRKRAGAQECRLSSRIEHDFGIEERTVHVRGKRSALSRVFYKPNSQLDIGITLAQAIYGNPFPSEKYEQLRQAAHKLLSDKNDGLEDFIKTYEVHDVGVSDTKKGDVLRMLWSAAISEKYSGASPEALAAHFIYMGEHITRLKYIDGNNLEAIFNFCDV